MKVKAVQDLPIGGLCGPFVPWKTTLSGSPTSCLTSLYQPTTPPRKGLAWARLRQLECLMCEAEIVSPPLLSVLVENIRASAGWDVGSTTLFQPVPEPGLCLHLLQNCL